MITTISLVNIKHHTIIFFRDNFKQLLLEVIFFFFFEWGSTKPGCACAMLNHSVRGEESRWRRNRTERSLSLLQIHRKNNRTVKKVYKTTSDR